MYGLDDQLEMLRILSTLVLLLLKSNCQTLQTGIPSAFRDGLNRSKRWIAAGTAIHAASLSPGLSERKEEAVRSEDERDQGHWHLKAGDTHGSGKGSGETGPSRPLKASSAKFVIIFPIAKWPSWRTSKQGKEKLGIRRHLSVTQYWLFMRILSPLNVLCKVTRVTKGRVLVNPHAYGQKKFQNPVLNIYVFVSS